MVTENICIVSIWDCENTNKRNPASTEKCTGQEKNPLTLLGSGTHYNLHSYYVYIATYTQMTKVLHHGFLTVMDSFTLNCVTSISCQRQFRHSLTTKYF